MRVKSLSKKSIEEFREKGEKLIQKIQKELKIDYSISLPDLIDHVYADLEKMGIIIGHGSLFDDFTHQSIPAVVTENRCLVLNDEFSEPAQLEALFHEYIHLKDDAIPVIDDILNDEKISDKKTAFRNMENLVDIAAFTLIMPPEELRQDLQNGRYNNIRKILKKYEYLQRCTVLQWITIISHFACHFAWVIMKKDKNYKHPYDCYYYDHINDPEDYDIFYVLNISTSAAARAVKDESYAISHETKVSTRKYQCFAFYEKGINRTLSNVLLHKTYVQYDRLIVIGWKRSDKEKFFRFK
ncbi:MAG: hypothetical protein LBU82_02630 [Treponema sp.]|jgi:Zn-dependent peptidase ImmA (M78 family)|nr:hypothetical protein [Treponema sp.]